LAKIRKVAKMHGSSKMKKRITIPSDSHARDDSQEKDSSTNFLTGVAYSERYYKILKTRKTLPAWDAKKPFLKLIKKHQVVILEGETGSGKTTQIPQFLVEAGYASKE